MSDQGQNKNPHLRDLFDTALAKATTPSPTPQMPHIVVNGHSNVFAWGGAVHLHVRRPQQGE